MSDDSPQPEKVSVRIPGLGEMAATGRDAAMILVVSLISIFFAWMLWQHDQNDREFQGKSLRGQSETTEAMHVQSYVLQQCTISKDRCDSFRLDMPDSLREKQRTKHRSDE